MQIPDPSVAMKLNVEAQGGHQLATLSTTRHYLQRNEVDGAGLGPRRF
jgi:hypothetical protein